MKNLLGSKDVELWTLKHEKKKNADEMDEMQHELENYREMYLSKGGSLDTLSLQRSMSMSPSKRGMSPPKEVRFDATSEKSGKKDTLAKLSKKFGADRLNEGQYKLSLRRTNSVTKELQAMDEETRVEHILNLMEKPKQLQRSMSLSRRSFMETGD